MLGCSDIALAVGMMAILVVLIPSLPPLLLDLSLAISITFSGPILTARFFIPCAKRSCWCSPESIRVARLTTVASICDTACSSVNADARRANGNSLFPPMD
jgi:type III secretory pathway component EscV